MERVADALVVGGGPAGAAAAAHLAKVGRGVVLVERQAAPHAPVCGEFMSAAAAAELGGLGFVPAAAGAITIGRTRIFAGRLEAAAVLPSGACGLSRSRLDQALLDLAAGRGVEVRRGRAVRALEGGPGTWTAVLSDGERIRGRVAVLATGKHDLRGHRRPQDATRTPVGFKMHWRLAGDQAAALGDAVELFLYDQGYAGLQPVEDGIANLCLVIDAAAVRGTGEAWTVLLQRLCALAPVLGRRLQGARPLWPRPAAIARVPYGYLCPIGGTVPGLYRVGDQAAVVHSLAGEGIAMALRSARLAARAVLAGYEPGRYAAQLRHEVAAPVRRAGVIASAMRQQRLRRSGIRLAAAPGVLPALMRMIRLPAGAPGG